MRRSNSLTDLQVEEVLSGRTDDADLTALAETMGALKTLRSTPKPPAADLISRAAAIAREESMRQVPRPLPKRTRVWKLAPAAATAVLAISMVAPLAALADTAAPNDFLYPVDRFFERFGIGAGGLAERLDEVNTLTERGDIEGARQHLEESLGAATAEELTTYAEGIEAAQDELDTPSDQVPATPGVENPNKDSGINSGNDSPGQDSPNAGPGNNSGNDNPNQGPGNNSGNQDNSGQDNPNKGAGNNSSNTGNQGNTEDNPNKGPGNNSGNTGNQGNTEDNPNKGSGNNSGNQGNRGGPDKGPDGDSDY